MSEIINSSELTKTINENSAVVDKKTTNNKEGLHVGTVKFYDVRKGYGFIKDANSGAEYYVRHSGLLEKIKQYDKVSFNLVESKSGTTAIDVELL